MGRMSEARKRAQKKLSPEATVVSEAPEGRAWAGEVPPPAKEAAPTASRIVLPPSGLAEDILARAEAAAVPAVVPETLPVRQASSPAPPVSTGESGFVAQNFSFFAAPAREEKKAVEAVEHLATFYLSSEEYGVDVRLVQEIIRVAEITQVPRAPEFIKGVINLRGRIIPVIDLKKKLSLGEVQPTRQARIVVVKLRDRLIGLLVDGASQVLKVPVSTIEAAPEEVVEIDANYIRGVAKLEKRLVILVDLQRILVSELRATAGPSAEA